MRDASARRFGSHRSLAGRLLSFVSVAQDRMPLDRRDFLAVTAASVAAAQLGGPTAHCAEAYAHSLQPGQHPVKVISSHNGLRATARAYELLLAGQDPLDAVIAGVSIVEADPDDLSVGYGGLPNEDGVVELDAAVMHGPTHRGGAVAALQRIRHPSQVARLVMEQSDHVLLVGEGALQFARAHGFLEENLLTEKARKIWLYWKQTHSDRDDWIPPSSDDIDPEVRKFFKIPEKPRSPLPKSKLDAARPTGTIHCAGLNARGDLACVTSTSGLAFKLPGRVGDSPILGAGLYVDNDVGSCGSTGRGEANLQNLSCFAAVELMRSGASPKDAGLEVLRRVIKHTTEKRLLDEEGRPNFGLKFYLLAKDGRHAGVSLWGPAELAVTDEQGTRTEACEFLFEKAED